MKRLMIGAALMLAACGGSDGSASSGSASGGSASAERAPGGGGASSYSAETVADAFAEYSNLDPEICACIGERALADLNDQQIEFLLVAISGDGDAAEAMTAELGVVNAAGVASFLNTAPASCAAEVGPE